MWILLTLLAALMFYDEVCLTFVFIADSFFTEYLYVDLTHFAGGIYAGLA